MADIATFVQAVKKWPWLYKDISSENAEKYTIEKVCGEVANKKNSGISSVWQSKRNLICEFLSKHKVYHLQTLCLEWSMFGEHCQSF